ncbi:DNA endonuclease SmrA [Vibrio genomosp. F10]|uniref:DNA mismatch repair protein MutS n=2 Tax=Vibrio genomosp. F10 TaxID=723171 RepID=A0A1B9R1A6_9VIBR|nr:DNA endonuclease SmrA [Vibrio genomosp. F10]OCH77975.1 DNA mismatch repair protein MutS [Vibrio genomosp. F10]OEE38449.1 DNA mismatch repair protein MutS [Vibrio genomosp. F10 str. ZF-129]OEE89180.1 DNA mismatch repair protein MutS [Vibrio genomosp. F10 str. 9ZD137]OEE93326.1 DNA mismatch repair protein MutS [Vibrio genomosp. F10 str. 9ZC157]OEF09170.1 DNA mismatch repair protein MutS [Vibrio genomosp. F10 str. 9ZB36]
MSHDDDFSLFQEMMGDVKPLTHDTAELKHKHSVSIAQQAKQQAAIWLTEDDPEYLSIDYAPLLKPEDLIQFKRDGVQHGVYKKLRLGKYPIQAKLDLHKKTLKEAREEVVKFLKQCLLWDIRTVLIVHGKGAHSNPPALMKSHLASWVTQIRDVQCAHSALQFHGGTGAIYLMLRKSDDKKTENRERHQKRMG